MTTSESPLVFVDNESFALKCFPVFHELRPHLNQETFLAQWHDQSAEGYEIVAIESHGQIAAIAGFRELTTMAWGHILYLDDLATLPEYRGRGYATTLIQFLQQEVLARGCASLHLDTGVTRHDAHRTYLRNGFVISSHHMNWATPHE